MQHQELFWSANVKLHQDLLVNMIDRQLRFVDPRLDPVAHVHPRTRTFL